MYGSELVCCFQVVQGKVWWAVGLSQPQNVKDRCGLLMIGGLWFSLVGFGPVSGTSYGPDRNGNVGWCGVRLSKDG